MDIQAVALLHPGGPVLDRLGVQEKAAGGLLVAEVVLAQHHQGGSVQLSPQEEPRRAQVMLAVRRQVKSAWPGLAYFENNDQIIGAGKGGGRSFGS